MSNQLSSQFQFSLFCLMTVAGGLASSAEALAAKNLAAADATQIATPERQAPRVARSKTAPVGQGKTVGVAKKTASATANTAATAPTSNVRKFTLTNAEQLNVRVRGLTDLNGTYLVNPDATVSIAGVGRLSVHGLGAEDLEASLAKRLSKIFRRQVGVSVEVTKFKPFFTTGQVVRAGATEWRSGLTLIQAISLAGGVSSPRASTTSGTSSAHLIRDQAASNLTYLKAELRRLEAEKGGETTNFSKSLMSELTSNSAAKDRGKYKDIVSNEARFLRDQLAIIQTLIAGHKRELRIARTELEANRKQFKAVGKRLIISKELMDSLQRLRKQKLVAKPRFLAQQQVLIANRVEHTRVGVMVERARARVATLQRHIENARQQRHIEINGRIAALQRDIAQLEIAVADPLRSPLGAKSRRKLTYHIARASAHGQDVKTIVASLFTLVEPGDVIIVSSKLEVVFEGASVDPSSLNPDARIQRMLQAAAQMPGARSSGGQAQQR